LKSDKWKPLTLHALAQHKIPPQEYLPDDSPFGKAQKLIFNVPIDPYGSIYCYIDNTLGLTIYIPGTENASQLEEAIPLAIKVAAQPDDKNEHIPCKAIVVTDKLLAEGGKNHSGIVIQFQDSYHLPS
jgi:hypothetical protein